jgi:hypothetical protein
LSAGAGADVKQKWANRIGPFYLIPPGVGRNALF